MMREQEIFRFSTKRQYEEAIIELRDKADLDSEEYDQLVDEYIRFCETEV